MAKGKSLILRGFKEDCEQLLTRFEQAQDIRFQTFCEIWKDMKFSLVFTGRPSYIELLEFCEEALHTCKKLLLLPLRFKERIGGLYLLYGIYYKMPTDLFKIRIKLNDWRSISELHAEIKEAEHLDANYILCKLILDNAFYFCIFDKEYGLEKHYRTKEMQSFNPYSVMPILKDMTDNQQIISKIKKLSKAYEEQKQVLISNTKTNTSLKLFNGDIAEEIINDIRDFEEDRKNQQVQSSYNCGASTSREFKKRPNIKTKMRPLLHDGYQTDSNDSTDDPEIEEVDSDIPTDLD
ncbi:proximal sequence element A Pbp45 isoform X2 [Halictus rubicundus]|uniref:proximal sequence element A Pbp45 isoform X2 n=1 Tax=Halictus rubicundus TaxID=77578 RepID=UPI0040352DD3